VFTPFLGITMVNPGFGGSGDPSAVNPNETENDRALIGEGIVIIVVIKTSAGVMVCITVKFYITRIPRRRISQRRACLIKAPLSV